MELFRRSVFLLYLYWASGSATLASEETGERLFLTPLINEGKLEEARNRSRVEPLLDNIESYAGYLTVNETTRTHLFFWFIPKTDPVNSTTAPLILWLGGGPGSSSLFGLFNGNGPFAVVGEGSAGPSLQRHAAAWTNDNHMLYIDQPADAGFSFTDGNGYVNSSTQAAEQLYVALLQFFTAFAEFAEHDLYLAGESYAGKYIPAAGLKIHQANQRAPVSQRLRLKGMIIGNGFTDPENMLDYDVFLHGVGLIYKSEREALQAMQEKIKYLIRGRNWYGAYLQFWKLVDAVQTSLNTSNYYDYRRVDEYEDPRTYASFVTQNHVRRRLHVGSTQFVSSSKTVERHFRKDFLQSARPWVEELVEVYPFLFYNGIFDIVCTALFTENYLDKFHWSGAVEFSMAKKKTMAINDKLAGYYKTSGNMLYVAIRNAGHCPTMDQPEITRQIINMFVNDTRFG